MDIIFSYSYCTEKPGYKYSCSFLTGNLYILHQIIYQLSQSSIDKYQKEKLGIGPNDKIYGHIWDPVHRITMYCCDNQQMVKNEPVSVDITVNRYIFAALNLCNYGPLRLFVSTLFLCQKDRQDFSEQDKSWIFKIRAVEPKLWTKTSGKVTFSFHFCLLHVPCMYIRQEPLKLVKVELFKWNIIKRLLRLIIDNKLQTTIGKWELDLVLVKSGSKLLKKTVYDVQFESNIASCFGP